MPSSTSPISAVWRRASASYATGGHDGHLRSKPAFNLVGPGAHLRLRGTERPELVASLVIIRPGPSSRDAVVARRVRPRDRLMARFAAGRLDNELARGVAPETRVALALRAHALGESGMRKALAGSLRAALREARGPQRPRIARVPMARSEALATAETLSELAERLTGPGPLGARGLAQVRLLLTDGASPLYWRGSAEDLHAFAARALEALEPAFPW